MSRFIVLCGKPFAGKTTLGKAIIEKFSHETVDVDVTKDNLYGLGLKDDDVTHEQWVSIYEETDKQIEAYLQDGRSIVDDSRNFFHPEDTLLFVYLFLHKCSPIVRE